VEVSIEFVGEGKRLHEDCRETVVQIVVEVGGATGSFLFEFLIASNRDEGEEVQIAGRINEHKWEGTLEVSGARRLSSLGLRNIAVLRLTRKNERLLGDVVLCNELKGKTEHLEAGHVLGDSVNREQVEEDHGEEEAVETIFHAIPG